MWEGECGVRAANRARVGVVVAVSVDVGSVKVCVAVGSVNVC
eukprot:gene18680-23482_t